MKTTRNTSHTRFLGRGPACLAVVVTAVGIAAAQAAPAAASYAWPTKPFHRQHVVRAFFGDPRIGPGATGLEHAFHFGIDIHAPNGTLVYASANGRVLLESYRPETVSVIADDGHTTFQYWHVSSCVRNGQRVIANRTVVGHVARWQHVHFSELQDGIYVNPLRAGALTPYRDQTRPTIRDFRVERSQAVIRPWRTRGRVDLVVEAYDPTPMALPAPWTGNPVTPARLTWRLCGKHGAVTAWQTAVDFDRTLPAADSYFLVYAKWTRQNKRARTGRYRFYLTHSWDSTSVANGTYRVEVAAADTRGNVGSAAFSIAVGN